MQAMTQRIGVRGLVDDGAAPRARLPLVLGGRAA